MTRIYLGIETSGNFSSVALIKNNEILGEYSLYTPRSHNEKIFNMLKNLMRETAISTEEITGVGVSIGPGMFTSLRTGLAIAKTISFLRNIPLKGINTLDAIAFSVRLKIPVIPIIDARKGEVFAAVYKDSERVTDYMIIKPSSLREIVEEPAGIVGPGVEKYKEEIQKNNKKFFFIQPNIYFPQASVIALLASRNIHQPDDIETLEPFYFRVTDAERNLNKTPKAG